MRRHAIFMAAFAGLSLALVSLAGAQEYKVGSIEVDQPWSTATPRGASVAAGYMTIKNTGTEPDQLTGISTPAAGKVEVHEMTMDNGIMRMRPLPSGLEIKPGQTVELKPSSFHLMLMNLKGPIQRGKPFKATLTFAKAGPLDVEFAVEPMGASGPPAAAAAHHH